MSPHKMKHSFTICPHCGCGCGLYIVEQDGNLSGTTASQGHAFGQGQLCARGWTCHQLLDRQRRLSSPMLGTPGKLSPTGWDEALSRTAGMLKGARDKHGGESIGVIGSPRLTEEEARSLRSLAEDVLRTPHFDSGARLEWVPAAFPDPGNYQDIEQADLIMVVGADLLEDSPVLGARVVSRTKPKDDRPYVSPDIEHRIPGEPAGLIYINSRQSPLSGLATINIRARPSREGTILAAVLKRLASELGSGPDGLSVLKESLAKLSYEKLLERSGTNQEDIAKATQMLLSAKRPLLLAGRNLWQESSAAAAWTALNNMSVLLAGRLKVMQAAAAANDAGCGAVLRSEHGMSYMEMVESLGSKKLKALVLAGEDPLRSLPGREQVRQWLGSVETLIVIDSFANNQAVGLAHAALPMPLPLEKQGSFRNAEGRLQEFKAAAEPPSGSRTLMEILDSWAGALGARIRRDVQPKTEEVRTFQAMDMPAGGEDGGFLLVLGSSYPHLFGGDLLTCNTPHLAREFAGGHAEMHPDDMAVMGLRSGWKARMVTEAGSMEAVIRANNLTPQKTVFMPVHFGGNALAPFRYDPLLKTPVLRGINVRIEKI